MATAKRKRKAPKRAAVGAKKRPQRTRKAAPRATRKTAAPTSANRLAGELSRAIKATNVTATRALQLVMKGKGRQAVKLAQRDASSAVQRAEKLLNDFKKKLIGR
jgi:hypothetical protein